MSNNSFIERAEDKKIDPKLKIILIGLIILGGAYFLVKQLVKPKSGFQQIVVEDKVTTDTKTTIGIIDDVVEEKTETETFAPLLEKSANSIVIRQRTWELEDSQKLAIIELVNQMHENPSKKLIINAHTDLRGQAAYNLNLTKKRASMIKRFIREMGYDISIETNGLGESQPITTGGTEKDHFTNSRIELIIK